MVSSFRSDGLAVRLCNVSALLRLTAACVLLVAISWEVLAGDNSRFSCAYLTIQLWVCLVFLADLGLRMFCARDRRRFLLRSIPAVLLSIPWLNICDWYGAEMTHDWGLLVGMMPLLRAFLAMTVVVHWLVGPNRVHRLLAAYLFTVVVFTYISALVFYDYEVAVNPRLQGFGNALWWAWMNVTTVGAEIFPVTTVGKIVCVILPSLGMIFFPVFTTYVLHEYLPKKQSDR